MPASITITQLGGDGGGHGGWWVASGGPGVGAWMLEQGSKVTEVAQRGVEQ